MLPQSDGFHQLRRLQLQIAMAGLRRLQPSGERKNRTFPTTNEWVKSDRDPIIGLPMPAAKNICRPWRLTLEPRSPLFDRSLLRRPSMAAV